MSAPSKPGMTTDDFLSWVETQPKEAGRFELLDGHIVTLQSERLVHVEVKFALAVVFREAIRQAKLSCFALPDGALIRISKTRAFQPDALVYCGSRHEPDSIEIDNPVIVCEVLSPDSIDRDHGEKLEGYFSRSSPHHYLIVDPDRRMIIHHRRATGDDLITRVCRTGAITLDPPGLTIDIDRLFERAVDV